MKTFRDFGIELPSGATGEVRAICPQCTPNRKPQNQNQRDLAVNVEKGTWQCFHCGWTGGLGSNSDETPRKEYHRPEYPAAWLQLPANVQEFFRRRGISPETCAKCQVGYQPGKGEAGAITFPRVKGGQVVAIKFRTHDKKFWQSKDPEPCFWNYDGAAKAGGDTLVIVEGEMDGMAMIESGVPAVVSVPNGAPALGAKDVSRHMEFLQTDKALLDAFQRIVLFVDSDAPGQALEEHLANHIGKSRCWRVASRPSDCKDANDVLLKHGAEAVRGLILRAKPYPIDGLYGIDDVADAVAQFYFEGLVRGASTGWRSLDELYTVIPGYWTLVTGIPSHGKSSVIDALAVNLWTAQGWKFAFCSPESLPVYRHVATLAEKICRRPFSVGYATNRRMTEEEMGATLKRMAGDFHFCALEDMSIDGVMEVMQAAVSRYGVKGVVLDPWNELEYHRPQRMSETEYVSLALGKLRRFARQNAVHLWLIAHPTKMKAQEDGSYPVPRPYDVSGCYDEKTEVLTSVGWVPHKEITEKHKIACFNTITGNIEYHCPTHIHAYYYKGEMHRYMGYGTDMLVTPNHRMIVKPKWGTNNAGKSDTMGAPCKWDHSRWSAVESRALTTAQFKVPNASIEPVPGKAMSFSNLDKGYTDTEAVFSLIGWYVSEGWHTQNSFAICQRESNKDKPINILDRLLLHRNESVDQPRGKGKQPVWRARIYKREHPELVNMILEGCGKEGAEFKKLPDFVFMASVAQREALLDSLIEGDGHKRGLALGRKKEGGWTYNTISKILADQIQRLCIDLGYKADISQSYPFAHHHKTNYTLQINRRDRKEKYLILSNNKESCYYNGQVYCLTVPTGAYVTRRNGKAAICGNSAHFANKADNCISVFRRDLEKPEVEIHVQKIRPREVGKLGSVTLAFDRTTCTFADLKPSGGGQTQEKEGETDEVPF